MTTGPDWASSGNKRPKFRKLSRLVPYSSDSMYRSSWNLARMQNFTDIGETDGVPVYSNELAN